MSLGSALSIASGGLANINNGISVISQNIANANTPEYIAEIAAQQALFAGSQPCGVQTLPTMLASDPAVQLQLNAAISGNSGAQITSSALANIAPVLGTVGSGNDLGSLLTNVQSAFSALLNDPSSTTQQDAVVQSASTLAQGINTLSQTYAQAQQSAQNSLVAQVGQLNTALGSIGSLCNQIESLQSLGQSTADLQNQLGQAENTVSTLVDARFVTQPDGNVLVMTANGTQLPTNEQNPLSIANATTSPSASYPGGGLPGIMLGNVDITAQLSGGAIAANVTLRDQTIPTCQASLDEFAENLSNRFAAQGLTLFSDPSGAVPQSTGTPTQSGYLGYASTITVNPAVTADPSLVRDGTNTIAGSPTGASAFTPNSSGLAGFTTLINRVLNYSFGSEVQSGVTQPSFATTGLGASGALSSGLSGSGALSDYANALTASQAADIANATSEAQDTSSVQTTLQTSFTSATGVDMDTELGKMVSLQNAYGANAKIISTVQALFADALAMVQ